MYTNPVNKAVVIFLSCRETEIQILKYMNQKKQTYQFCETVRVLLATAPLLEKKITTTRYCRHQYLWCVKATVKLSKWQLFSCFLLRGKRNLWNAHLKGYHDLRHYSYILKMFCQVTGIKMERENLLLLTLFA